jgi:hypothetical protein
MSSLFYWDKACFKRAVSVPSTIDGATRLAEKEPWMRHSQPARRWLLFFALMLLYTCTRNLEFHVSGWTYLNTYYVCQRFGKSLSCHGDTWTVSVKRQDKDKTNMRNKAYNNWRLVTLREGLPCLSARPCLAYFGARVQISLREFSFFGNVFLVLRFQNTCSPTRVKCVQESFPLSPRLSLCHW